MRYFDGIRWADQPSPFNPIFTAGAMQPPLKSAAAAGVLQLFFGTFGIGRFYIGSNSVAATQLALGLVGLFFTMFCFVGIFVLIPLWIWTFIDAIMMFAGAVTDGYGRKLE